MYRANVNFSKLILKSNARVPEFWIQNGGTHPADIYPLLGDRYVIGRSSRACDIVIRNSVVSQVHCSLTRKGRGSQGKFMIRDENSTNGIYRGRQRLKSRLLRHGDVLTLGPPELANAVRIRYVNPPPWSMRLLHYGLIGFGLSVTLALSFVLLEWQKFSVQPLPVAIQGPVVVYARDGSTPLQPPQNQAHVELKQLSDFSPYLPKAVVASEDSRYYWHIGVDPIGITRALVTNLRGGEIREGASTLTQQLARNLFREYVGTQDSAGRKLREAVVALKLESYYSKNSLLTTYLNKVYLGSGTYGFEDAAQFYFGKSAQSLTLAEAATLVGILPAPNRFNPVRDYEAAVEYRDRVLERMAVQGMISAEEAQRARRSRIQLNPKARQQLESTLAPYFYAQVFSELQALLGEQLAQEGNFIVETGLDLRLQKHLETTLRQTVTTTGVSYRFSQGAAITLDAKTGGILALVGGVDYQKSEFNRATQSLRQPGSTFKIFTYTAALERGISPASSYSCSPLTWQGQDFAGCHGHQDSLDMYAALASSENVIALRMAQDVGLPAVVKTAQRMGITAPLKPVPGLILGQSEVTLLEMTGAFGVLANQGYRNRPHAIQRILDSSDCRDRKQRQTCRVIYDYAQGGGINVPVLQPAIAAEMTTLLQGVVRSGTGQAAALGLGEAGKTGTTNDGVDLWFIGYVPSRQLVAGVWLGNDDNTPTAGSSAQAAQLWGDYMRQAVQ
ncbi:PBP1A family penicillin-binding protein [Neosynechococcus sphagnicola]|uniref:PBP1A family penicillin-binding protein n=1 Tax=Neosynechococcus sphagnicola TaxID=1501145 RepID=UPI00068B91CF|nr:PBP1A family penicillin-binding protein [Neosynechococcus sphagnicola]